MTMTTDCLWRTVSWSSLTECIVLEGSSICWQRTALKVWYGKQWAQNLRVTKDTVLDNGAAPALCREEAHHLRLLWPGGGPRGERRLTFGTAVNKVRANIKTLPRGIRLLVLLKALMVFACVGLFSCPKPFLLGVLRPLHSFTESTFPLGSNT